MMRSASWHRRSRKRRPSLVEVCVFVCSTVGRTFKVRSKYGIFYCLADKTLMYSALLRIAILTESMGKQKNIWVLRFQSRGFH